MATLKQAGPPTPEKQAQSIFEALRQPQLTAHEVTIKTKSRVMLALVAQLLPRVEQITASDQELAELCLTPADSPICEGLPGAGKRLAPRRARRMGR